MNPQFQQQQDRNRQQQEQARKQQEEGRRRQEMAVFYEQQKGKRAPQPTPAAHGSSQLAPQQIFISYRRDDTAYAAGRLYDRLSAHFGTANVFMDIDAIELGVNFRERIENAVGNCDVLIAMIGKQWLNIKNQQGHRRLDEPNDFVRLEILAALQRGIHVIPVLIDGASVPSSTELPSDLSPLSERNGLEIRHSHFTDDANRLIKGIESILSPSHSPVRIHEQIPLHMGEVDKAQESKGSSGCLVSVFRSTLLGLVSGLILGSLGRISLGYPDTLGWNIALSSNIAGGIIIGFLGTRKWTPVLIGMLCGFTVVLGFYLFLAEPIGDTIAGALVLGCAPGAVLGAIVDRVRSGKH